MESTICRVFTYTFAVVKRSHSAGKPAILMMSTASNILVRCAFLFRDDTAEIHHSLAGALPVKPQAKLTGVSQFWKRDQCLSQRPHKSLLAERSVLRPGRNDSGTCCEKGDRGVNVQSSVD